MCCALSSLTSDIPFYATLFYSSRITTVNMFCTACSNEAFKLLTFASQTLNTYMMYMGSDGVYTSTYSNERNSSCIVCSDQADIQIYTISKHITLKDFLDKLCEDVRFQLKKPSLVGENKNVVYMQGPLEKVYRNNLNKTLSELIADGELLTVTDPVLQSIALSLQMHLTDDLQY